MVGVTYVAMFYIWVKLMYLYGIWYLEFASEVCYLLRILQKWELFEQCFNVTRIFDVLLLSCSESNIINM